MAQLRFDHGTFHIIFMTSLPFFLVKCPIFLAEVPAVHRMHAMVMPPPTSQAQKLQLVRILLPKSLEVGIVAFCVLQIPANLWD